MATGDSRGGGYDAFIDKQSEKRKTLSASDRQDVASSSASGGASGNLEAPSSLGDIMSPSAGRAAPAATPEEYGKRVAENQTFLESPETKGMMLQFATAMLGGTNPMAALGLALQMPGRMELAREKRANSEDVIAAREERLLMAQERLGMAQDKFQTEKDKEEKRATLFGSLGTMTDENLMKAATELAANGDYEGARVALSMRKDMSGESDALLRHYTMAKEQGYTGDLMQFQQDMYHSSVIEGIRKKMLTGTPLSPIEQQIYNDSLSGDPILRQLMRTGEATATPPPPAGTPPAPNGPTTPTTPTGTPAPAPSTTGTPQSGSSGNVPFRVITTPSKPVL